MVDAARRHTAFRIVTKSSRVRALPAEGPTPLATGCHPDTIGPQMCVFMAPLASEVEWAARLSGQLETLSELAEHLTYRLLEIEERLAGQDNQLAFLQTASDELTRGLDAALEERMLETEDRLARIETLLQGEGQRRSPFRSLRALPKPSTADTEAEFPADEAAEQELFLHDIHGEHIHEEAQPDGEELPIDDQTPLIIDDDLIDSSLAG